jgi:hypothetical protein
MSHIFVSYKRDNLDRVEPIVNELKRHHFVWIDRTGIPGGNAWEEKINAALAESAALILMVSPEALESRWVQYEYQTALAQGLLVIPVMLEDCRLPSALGGLQYIALDAEHAFEHLMDALPDASRIWGDVILPESELQAERTFDELAALCAGGILQPTDDLVGLPIKQTRYCKVYLVGKREDTLEPLDTYQLALQLTNRHFALEPSADRSYPQDDFVISIADHFLTSPSKRIRLYLVRGPLNQPHDVSERLSFGLNVQRPDEWSDVVNVADYARGRAKNGVMQLFINGPGIITYQLGASNPGFSRYELYQLDYTDQTYHLVLSG